MKPSIRRFPPLAAPLALLTFFCLVASQALADFSITEIKAVAEISGTDEDGAPSDWIEITNTGNSSASLEGYHLTNDAENLTRWQFPSVSISGGSSIVVFASRKDRTSPGSPLHASFTLDRKGDYLGLIAPDGVTVVSEFTSGYPEQYPGSSYGYGTSGLVTRQILVAADAQVNYFIPTDDSLGDRWKDPSPDFDDSAWSTAVHPVGFESNGGTLEPLIATNIASDMKGVNAGGYFRFPFVFDAVGRRIVSAQIGVTIDDGYAAYLNGVEISKLNYTTPLEFNSRASASRLDSLVASGPLSEDISAKAGSVVGGNNVLAVQAMNRSSNGSDFMIGVELVADVQDTSGGAQFGFFKEPSPGSPNGIIFSTPPGEVVFSSESKLFEDNFELELTCETPGAVIRYTTDQSLPSNEFGTDSELYTEPFAITKSTQIRAQAFLPGALDGKIGTETFLKMSGSVPSFTSNLPIIVMSTLGRGAPPDSGSTTRKDAYLFFFEPDPETGRTTLTQAPQVTTRSGVRKRGSSSAGWPKYGMSVETWNDGNNEDNNIKPLGFAREADWIFNSRWNFDLALMRNPLIYDISRQIGRYATRSRFVELYNDASGSDLNDADYFGVYSLMEKIEADPNRVEIDRLMPWDNSGEEITGGYIFKRDRNDAGSPPTYNVAGAGGSLIAHDPGGREVSSQQKTYIQNYLNQMNVALMNRPSGINQSTGLHFSEYLDVGSFIDHQWLNTLAMNVDWGRLSAYYYKHQSGLVDAGPIWDFDRNMGSEDGRDSNPRTWNGSGDSSRTWYDGRYPWFGNLIGPNANIASAHYPDVRQRHTDRWFELRQGGFATESIHATIDRMADEIREAQVRNFAKWSSRRPNGGNFAERGTSGWEAEVSHLKGWMKARAEWIDGQYAKYTPPEFKQPGGVVPEGFEVTMISPNAQVYYTTDGSDPRLTGGEVSPSAVPFEGGPVDTVLIDADASCRYFVPSDDSLGLTWTKESFDDASWAEGINGLGYETPGGPLEPFVSTNLYELMRSPNRASSAYVRYEFDFDNVSNINSFIMKAMTDDGFAAFLNGVEVVSFQAPVPLVFDSRATRSRLDSLVVRESSLPTFDLTEFKGLLRNGKNLIAVQGMNTSPAGSDFLFRADLEVNHTVTATPFKLDSSAVVTARAFDGTLWSAPSQKTFVVGDAAVNNNNLVVSEFMYRPPQESDEEDSLGFTKRDDFEFIELLNIGESPVSLLGSAFTDGVDFNFNNGSITMVQPGQRVLLVKNAAAFAHRYGEAAAAKIAGEFEDSTGLSNDGETLAISGADGNVVRAFTYNDKEPWPEGADGDGFSLELISPDLNPDHNVATNWQLSSVVGGSPGEEGAVVEGQTFASWSQENGGVEPTSDTDNDGRSGLVEFAMGTNPRAFENEGGLINVDLVTVEVDGNQEERLQITFEKNQNAVGVTLVAEWSDDLVKWAADDERVVSTTIVVREGDVIVATYTRCYIVVTPEKTKPAFLRLKATMR